MKIHDNLREWTRIEDTRHPSPSEAIIDSQSVKTAAIVSEEVGFDAGKKIKGRKRFLSVDTGAMRFCEIMLKTAGEQGAGGRGNGKRTNKKS
ncbi:hypothetical protein [Nostoc sp. WHI]|uniref:hypothetical protein n=1 Tax=Nostoc sp. WHI TaxID=2650611 RepID=UPI003FA5735B